MKAFEIELLLRYNPVTEDWALNAKGYTVVFLHSAGIL